MKRPNEYSKPLAGDRLESYHPADIQGQYVKDLNKYIDYLEEEVKKLHLHGVSKSEDVEREALLLVYGKFLSEKCTLISPNMENHKPYIRKFLSQQ
jgi:hypothetical protein